MALKKEAALLSACCSSLSHLHLHGGRLHPAKGVCKESEGLLARGSTGLEDTARGGRSLGGGVSSFGGVEAFCPRIKGFCSFIRAACILKSPPRFEATARSATCQRD